MWWVDNEIKLWRIKMGIVFCDRALESDEKYHHHCTKCGQDLHPDLAYSHKCNPIIKRLN